jgi:hypothetical protein
LETTILAFKRAKTVLVLDRAATVIGNGISSHVKLYQAGLDMSENWIASLPPELSKEKIGQSFRTYGFAVDVKD